MASRARVLASTTALTIAHCERAAAGITGRRRPNPEAEKGETRGSNSAGFCS